MEQKEESPEPLVYAVRSGRQCGLVGTVGELLQHTAQFRHVEYAVFKSGLAAAQYVARDALTHEMLPRFPPASVFVEVLVWRTKDDMMRTCVGATWHMPDGSLAMPLMRLLPNDKPTRVGTVALVSEVLHTLQLPKELQAPPMLYLAHTEIVDGEPLAVSAANGLLSDLELHTALQKRPDRGDRTVFDPDMEAGLDKLAEDTKKFVLQNGNDIHHLYPYCLLFSTTMRTMQDHLNSKA